MKQGYFNYEGKICSHGTIINIKPRYNKYGILCDKATFLEYMPEKKWYIILLGSDNKLTLNENEFFDMLIGVTETKDEQYMKQFEIDIEKMVRGPDFKTELSIDGMLVAWVWYIVLMVIITFFYERIVGYTLFSIIFFAYRNRKLREAGYK